LCLFFIQQYDTAHLSFNLVAGTTILFVVGLKDDLVILSPLTKIISQLLAISFVLINFDLLFVSFHGFLGIEEVPVYVSILLEYFIFLAIINTYNLIDGIDGLSGGIGVLANLTFGFWFLLTDNIQLAILSFALTGSLLAFLRFNLFSVKNKIFMGDTGALVVGFIMAVLVIKFNDLNGICTGPYKIGAAPAVSIGILIVPIFDTVRVFILRILKGKSPFLPDKQHVHHYLVKLTGSHKKSTSIILLVNVAFIVISLLLSGLRIYQLTLILFALAAILSYIPFVMVKKKRVTQ